MRGRFLPIAGFVLAGVALLALPADAARERGLGRLKADHVLVVKGARQMLLHKEGRVIRRYRVALGRNPAGQKREEGDGRTPEGVYVLDWRNPRSNFHRSIHISYPNGADLDVSFVSNRDPGGLIMIHGLPNGLQRVGRDHIKRWGDWTDGCIAVTNREMDEVWAMVDDGTIIEIRP